LILKGLSSRGAAAWIIVVATLLAATSVGPHRALDDFVLALIARSDGAALGLTRGSLDLFTFTTGDPQSNRRLMDSGLMLPWWTDPELHIAFFRPLSSLTHYLDETLWPATPALMHLQSLLWFTVMLATVALVYARLEVAALAGLSFLLYAVDDANGPPLAWLANRNALISTAFGCLALALHDVWRRRARPLVGAAAVAAFVLGLLASEYAIGVGAYLLAYAVCLDQGSARSRLLSLLPYGGVVFVWRLLWTTAGFGTHGSGVYIDPIRDPGGFLSVAPSRVLLLLQAEFSGPPADLAFLGSPATVPLLVGLAAVTLGGVAWLVVPILRRDARARFWALGMVLAVLPLSSTFPSDRLLLFASLGGAALVARVLDTQLRAWLVTRRASARGVAAALLGFLHLVVAPVLLVGRSAQMEHFAVAERRAARSLPTGPSIRGKAIVIVAAPSLLFSMYIPAERRVAGEAHARYQYVLASASSPIHVERTGDRQITLRPEQGFLYAPLERHYRGGSPFRLGQEVRLSAMTARIRAMQSGRPSAVSFDFPAPSRSYVFVTWRDGRYVPFEIPPPGESVLLPEEDVQQLLLRSLAEPIAGSRAATP
jgi:hypothetical protein